MTARLTDHEWQIARAHCTPKQLEALNYWRHGYGYKRIGMILDIGSDNARGLIQRALFSIRPPTPDPMLTEQMEILQRERQRAQDEGLLKLTDCYLCGMPTPGDDLQTDHVIPRIAGGSEADFNKLFACSTCNARKKDRIVAFDVATRQPIFLRRA